MPQLMHMNMRNTQLQAPAIHNVLDIPATDPLTARRQEQSRVAIRGPVLFDIVAERLQGFRANHELPPLAPLTQDFSCAEELDCSVGPSSFPLNNAVLVQLAEL
jgi:hypothetical protein